MASCNIQGFLAGPAATEVKRVKKLSFHEACCKPAPNSRDKQFRAYLLTRGTETYYNAPAKITNAARL
jgi:hypothetical protein